MDERKCGVCGSHIVIDKGKVEIISKKWFICKKCYEWIRQKTAGK